MSSTNLRGNEPAGRAQTSEHEAGAEGVEQSEGRLDLRASVAQEIQAKIDYADERAVEGRLFGQTLEAQERLEARAWEVERTRTRGDREQESDREKRTRRAVAADSDEWRAAFEKRAGSVDPWLDPERADPQTELSREELGAVNEQAMRLDEKLAGWSRAAISRRLAERVADGTEITSAVVGVYEELEQAPGQVVPIAAVQDVSRREVDIRGTVTQLWNPSNPAIQQVGLIEDESGRIKFTVWRKSRQGMVREGEDVTFRGVAKNWYQGRVSVALTGWSRIVSHGVRGQR
ncbi:DNA-binding protein [Halostella litorea]|uniref:DNA-binding protein n=1 Tax=Halostella litorea TaxID=2528831 RepID=UPI00192A3061|nr:DNA-binding protein [Halostella litorea]